MPKAPYFCSPLIRIALASLLALALAAPALAEPPPGKGKGKGGAKGDDASLAISVSAGISVGDARQIASRYGLTGAKPLPPGIQKNLARGKPLPPGIAKQQLPGGYLGELPRHEGQGWYRIGADLVLLDDASLRISAVLQGVFD